jgi:nucleoid-associated protein YgaU
MPKPDGEDLSAMYKKMAAEKLEAFKRKAELSKIKTEHTVVAGETLSHIALKYYGKSSRDYWMLIYEANKEEIGSNPGMIKAGAVLKIPELPEDMK